MKKIIFLFIVMASFSFSQNITVDNNKDFNKALGFYNSKKFDDALILFKKIADRTENNTKITASVLFVCKILVDQKKYSDAEKSGKDFEPIDVVRGYAKKLKKTMEEYERLKIQNEVDSCNEELKIVEEFMPKQMSDEELEKVVTELIESEKPGDIGSTMKIVMGKYKDVADGKKVQTLVKKIFSK